MTVSEQQVAKEARRPRPLSTNSAVAHAVKDLDVDVVSAYPITPQTTVVEKIAEFIAEGELDAEMIHVESEHSALSAAVASALTGARSFTATASQGLELMHEILHIASGLRAPLVMSVAMRALSAPISIWNDQSDVMNARDTGWVIYFVSSAQEAYDTVIQAYRIAEDPEILLPVMVAYDGFVMSHTMEPVVTEDRDQVLRYAPKRPFPYKLDPERPVTIGTLVDPDWYYEIKYQNVEAMRRALEKAREADEEFGKAFGRSYGLIECYMCDDAEALILANSSYAASIKAVLPRVRKEGLRVGLLRLRLYRPFPENEMVKHLENVKSLLVIDRAISYGAPYQGPLANEMAGLLLKHGLSVNLVSVVAGIGQRRMIDEDFVKLARMAWEARTVKYPETIFYGVRK
jgi:pyruvate ferredoxin oxidoreductase alpha subunit